MSGTSTPAMGLSPAPATPGCARGVLRLRVLGYASSSRSWLPSSLPAGTSPRPQLRQQRTNVSGSLLAARWLSLFRKPTHHRHPSSALDVDDNQQVVPSRKTGSVSHSGDRGTTGTVTL